MQADAISGARVSGRPAPPAADPAARCAWAVWAAATLVALFATGVHGRWLPWSDDFDVLPYVTGDRPVSLGWLWQRHNEHHIPLPKLLFVGLGRLSGADFRWTLVANALALSAAAAAALGAARRLRGRSAWTDVAFPALLLHLGQGALGWAFQSQFVLTTLLGVLFVTAAVAAPRAAVWRGCALAACGCLLPLTGINGLVVAAPAGVLLLAEAFGPARLVGPRPALARWVAAAGAAVMLALAILSVATLRLQPQRGYAGPWRAVATSLHVLAAYAGDWVSRLPAAWLLFTGLALVGTVTAALVALRRGIDIDRFAVTVLLGALAALWLVALAIGYGRGGHDVTGPFYGHYGTLALGVPVTLQLLWAALPSGRWGRVLPIALCAVALLIAGKHLRRGVRAWGADAEGQAVIATALRGDVDPETVAARHAAALYFVDTPEIRAKIAACVPLLRRSTFPLYCTRPAAGAQGQAGASAP